MIQVTTEDITRARYFYKDGMYYVKVFVKKDGVGGAIDFAWFKTKKDAQEFYRLLKIKQK